jgi:carbon monoxide dehydrogenase subunit G
MEMNHEFTVPAHVERAWEVLTDVEQIAPCMPGAELTEVDGDTYHGTVKVKVGPITVQYKGTAHFVEKDEAAHRVVLKAAGRDARGQGNAAATVTALMTPDGGSTTVSISTELSISGKVAQFGRGVMHDVSAKLLEQFASNIEADLLAPAGTGAAAPAQGATAAGAAAAGAPSGAAPGGTPAPRQAPGEPVRLVGMTLTSVMNRFGQAIARFFRRLTGRGGN